MKTSPLSKRVRRLSLLLLAVVLSSGTSHAVLFDATGSGSFNTTAPTGSLAGSGWQYQGLWAGGLGTAIAPNYFVTAEHIGGAIGQSITLGGTSYVTNAFYDDPGSDLRIWRIAGLFPTYAPLYTGSDEIGKELVVFGRGYQRGGNVTLGPDLKGWYWDGGSNAQRWGTNDVVGVVNVGGGLGQLLYANFDHIGGTEAHLSPGDSGGAVFIKDPSDSVWKLAGINYGVDGPFYTDSSGGGQFYGALFDTTGFYQKTASNTYVPVSGPSSFYSTRISADLSFILAVVPEPTDFGVVTGLLMLCVAMMDVRRRRRV